MTSPSFDTTFAGHAVSFNSPTGTTYPTSGVANKTGGTNRVMVLAVAYDSGSSSTYITGITDSLSVLTWSYVGKVANTVSGSNFTTIEIWTAPATAVYNSGLVNSIQNVTFSAAISQGVAFFAAVQGCNSITSPFDGHSGLPASAFAVTSTTPPTVTFSTTQADDLLVAFTAANNTFGWSTPAGWTNEAGHGQSGGDDCFITGDYQSVSAAQTSATYTNAGTNNNYWTSIVVAFTADAGSGVTGTMAPTEADDTFSGAGYVPITATFGPTENIDTFAGVGYTALTAAMAVTENPDTFAGVGYGPPARSGRRRVFIIS